MIIYLTSIEILLLLHFIDKQWSLNINPGHIWQSRLKHNSELNSDDQWRIKGFGGPGQKKCAGLHVRKKKLKMDLAFLGGGGISVSTCLDYTYEDDYTTFGSSRAMADTFSDVITLIWFRVPRLRQAPRKMWQTAERSWAEFAELKAG